MASSPARVTAQDAAYWAGRSVGTIWRWASEGRITVYGQGKNARYDVMEIEPARRDPDTRELIEPAPAPPVTGRRRILDAA
ncbi:helix-turn-helix domain-containing protein [Streptomyces sp. R302]|uniref:helix-turn-helix domain-containing protein n=1 Tax=unclassified Streptomyces TaxID=2593676 RepID=UPI00145E056E|nr:MULTISPECIES: helix-turn-helix domain-containing protein [unclassified Streptomyces]NML55375.1 helix-turn-helix domain-containing protein [Streptomyces sp. R301]NML80247.1 helix-turn-helix domain-containing protein [Streptomyces sp. R302]